MEKLSIDEMMLFEGHPNALGVYEAFVKKLFQIYPDTTFRVQKTQITFSNRRVYACVSFARVKKKAQLPENYIVVTLGLPMPLESHRIAVKTEPYPGRWTHHLVIASEKELDGEFFSWVDLARNFPLAVVAEDELQNCPRCQDLSGVGP